VATIGVHGWDLEPFLDALRGLEDPVVIDVRQRRGVRGREYAWANARRLQAALDVAGIGYRHVLELAPTTELRRQQYAADDVAGVGKRSRSLLDAGYAAGYTEQVLDHYDMAELLAELPEDATPVLLCVEEEQAACHRSLVAERLAEHHGASVVHLEPPGEAASAGPRAPSTRGGARGSR
jgi:uncharacterized protein (DUF488 family)